MKRYNFVIMKTWAWWKPWVRPQWGTQEVVPINHLWPEGSFVKTNDAERIEVLFEATTSTLELTTKELKKNKEWLLESQCFQQASAECLMTTEAELMRSRESNRQCVNTVMQLKDLIEGEPNHIEKE